MSRRQGLEAGGTVTALRPDLSAVPPRTLTAQLGPPPPSAHEVQAGLQQTLLDHFGDNRALDRLQSDVERYYGVYYAESTGRLSLRRVAVDTGDHRLDVSAQALEGLAKAGERVLGGLHNHPEYAGVDTSQPSDEDRAASKALQASLPGYQDFVLSTTDGGPARLAPVDTSGAVARADAAGVATFSISSRKVLKKLRAAGWATARQKGSHVQLKHPSRGGTVTVPHPKKDLPLGTVRSIERQSGVSLT